MKLIKDKFIETQHQMIFFFVESIHNIFFGGTTIYAI